MKDSAPHPQLRAIEVRVSCMLHGMNHMRGSAAVYNLGHGRTHQTTGSASCDACQDDTWLRLELFEEEVTEVANSEYAAALMAALETEIGTPDQKDEEVADEESVPDAVGANAPPTSASIPFQRRPLVQQGDVRR